MSDTTNTPIDEQINLLKARIHRIEQCKGYVENSPIVDQAIRVFGGRNAAYNFLCEPHPLLGQLMPIEVIYEGDPSTVTNILNQIEAG